MNIDDYCKDMNEQYKNISWYQNNSHIAILQSNMQSLQAVQIVWRRLSQPFHLSSRHFSFLSCLMQGHFQICLEFIGVKDY